MVCKSDNGKHSSKGHIEVNYQSPEKVHGKVHIETIDSSQPHPIVIDSHFEGVYQGSDCHGISPDAAKVIH